MNDEPLFTTPATAPLSDSSGQRSLFRWAVGSSLVLVTLTAFLQWLAASPYDNRWLLFAIGLPLFLATSIGPAFIVRHCGERVFDGRRPIRVAAELGVAMFGVFVLFLLLCGATAVLPESFVRKQSPQQDSQEAIAYFGTMWHWVLFTLAACVWAPIFEEIGFRRFLFRAFERRMGTFLAAIVSSGIFAVVHSYAGYGTIVIFVIGLLLCTVYARRRTLVTPMLLHALNNSVFSLALLTQIQVQPHSPALGVQGMDEPGGYRIVAVHPGSPAEAAGLQIGDRIVEIDRQRIENVLGMRRILQAHDINDVVNVTIERNRELKFLDVRLTQTMAEMREASQKLPVPDPPRDAAPQEP